MKLETMIKRREELDSKIKAAREAEARKKDLAPLLAKLQKAYSPGELCQIISDLLAKTKNPSPTETAAAE